MTFTDCFQMKGDKMKKLILIPLTVTVLTVTLAACGGSDDMSMEDSDEGQGESGDMDDHGGAMMGMREVEGIDLRAGSAVTLKPGGFHIMLMGLAGPIKEGDTIPVTLTFEQAGEMVVDAPAREG